MRNLILPLSITSILLFSSSYKSDGMNFVLAFFLFILFFSAFSFSNSFSRIKNNIEDKTRRIKAVNPSDISSVSDGKGGTYIFWKEGGSALESKVYFAHVNLNDEYSTKINGEKISALSFIQKNPISVSYISDDAILAWKDYSDQIVGDIFLQRISDGELLWGGNGVRVTTSPEQIFDYSLSSDNSGNIFVAYLTRGEYPSNDYKILYQRILSDGSLTFKNESIPVEISARKKNNLKIFHDNSGGAFILWTEKISDKESLLIKKVDPSGKSVLGKRPIRVSGSLQNTLNFCESIISNSFLYIAWETDDKNIYHQLINNKGKAIWTVGGIKATLTKGNNKFPRTIQSDSLILLSWLNEYEQNKTLTVQKFKTNGKEIWKRGGVQVANIDSGVSDFSIADDGENEIFISWLSGSSSSSGCGIDVQRISNKGKLLWDSLKTNASSSANCEKRYLSVSADINDYAIIVYEDLSNQISIEKVKKFQRPEHDFLSLSAETNGKAIKLKMNTNIKNEKMIFIIERLAHSDTSANVWEYIGSVDALPSADFTEYEFTDNTVEYGTLYYRTILKSNSKELLSNISRIDYLEAASKIIVAQNNPNPFRDSTVINFYLPVSTSVAFEFFDEHAEKIEELAEKEFPAGENNIIFYAKGLQPGIYFYKLFTRDFVEVKKMVVD
jgi:hypothetical protein